ncbi:MAG: CopA family copper-resistance protein [Spirosomataceae bacterium]|jgi:CopA family copper-resistance protein
MKPLHKLLLPLFIICLAFTVTAQEVVHYDLTISDIIINFTGKEKHAIAVNGQFPMPTLTFYQGDTAEIVVHNKLKEPTALHWHGLMLPNEYDGVPWLTQRPIMPGETFTYRFPIIQNGTHWYHSHAGLQEQIGMYGNMVLKKREPGSKIKVKNEYPFRKGIDDLPTLPVVLSEWTDLKPQNVQRMLRFANDYAAIKKGSTQSYGEAILAGKFKTKLGNEWKRMLAMDVSDVYYEQVMMNGKADSQVATNPETEDPLKAGDKVRLRIANGGGSSYFWLTYAGGKITVVANDGNDVEPVDVDRLIIGVSETYDVVVTIPAAGTAFEFLATTEDRVNTASLFIGEGVKQLTERLPRLKYFDGMKMMNDMMNMDGSMDDMSMKMSLQKMDMNRVMYPEITGEATGGMKHDHSKIKMGDMKGMDHSMMEMANQTDITTLNYSMLKSPIKTMLPAENPTREMYFELTGNMNRYVWSMDGKVLSEVDKILVKKGENLRIVMYNASMMRHPMHLHGHDFRVINGQGEYAPMMNVIDIMPMETDTIEFAANYEGDWFFHCHILYHMMAGMNRVISYEDQAPNPFLPDRKAAYDKLQKESNRYHLMAENDFATNGNDGMAMLQNTRWSIGTEWRLGYNDMHGYETETHIGRYIGKMQWLMPFVGFDWRYRKFGIDEKETNLFGQSSTKDNRSLLSVGFNYTLPMLSVFQAEVFQNGDVRLQLMREDIPLTPRLRGAFMINTDKEYMGGLKYVATKNIGISTHYDSDMGWGAGVTLMY